MNLATMRAFSKYVEQIEYAVGLNFTAQSRSLRLSAVVACYSVDTACSHFSAWLESRQAWVTGRMGNLVVFRTNPDFVLRISPLSIPEWTLSRGRDGKNSARNSLDSTADVAWRGNARVRLGMDHCIRRRKVRSADQAEVSRMAETARSSGSGSSQPSGRPPRLAARPYHCERRSASRPPWRRSLWPPR